MTLPKWLRGRFGFPPDKALKDPERTAQWQRIHALQKRLDINVPHEANGDMRYKDFVLLQMIVLERMMTLIEKMEERK